MDLVGRVVNRKLRDSGDSKGMIESYDTSTGFFKLTYDDGDSEEMDLLNATSLLQSVPEKVANEPGRTPNKRRPIRDDPGEGFGNAVDSDNVQSYEGSAAEIGVTRNLYDGVIANGVELNGALDLNSSGAIVDAQRNSCFRASVVLNLSAVNDSEVGEVENKELGFDLNLVVDEKNVKLETDQLVDVPVEMVESKFFSSPGIVKQIDVESVCFNVTLDDSVSAQCVVGDEDEKVPVRGNTSDLTGAADVNINSSYLHLKEGCQEVGTQVLCAVETHGCRKRRKLISALRSPEEASLRRSARRAKAVSFAQNNDSSNEVKDIHSSGISTVSEEKPDLSDSEEVDESEVLPPRVALPPSSNNLNLEEIPVIDFFSVYACLRSFSTLLYLSPFRLEDFVASLKSKVANTLLDSVHVAILQTLRKHLEFLSDDGSEPAAICLRNLNWDLLDVITWPIFLVEYLLIHGSGPNPCLNIGSLKLVNSDYYKQSAEVKIAILQRLCDDVIEVECIRAELNRRISASDFGADFDRNLNNATFKITRASSGSAADTLFDEGPDADITDWNIDECCLCKMEGNLICCDGCPYAYHSRCVGVTSSLLPEGEWYCPECVSNGCNLDFKPQKLIRGAELLGADLYGRIYFHCCGYLLVAESFDAESSFSYYHKDDFSIVISVLESCGFPCGSIMPAISKRLMAYAELDQQKNHSESPSVLILQAVCKPTEHFMCSNNGEEGNERKSEGLGNPATSSEGSVEVLQGCEPSESCNRAFDKASSVSENTDLSSVHLAVEKTGLGAKQHKRGRPPGVHCKSSATKAKGAEAPPVQDDAVYVNSYSFGQTTSSIAEEITRRLSNKISETLIKSEEEIISTQLKSISKKSMKFCWPSFRNIHVKMQKEKCEWCYSCKSSDGDRDCLFKLNTTSFVSEGLIKAELDVFQSEPNTKGHLVDLCCYILSMEHRLRGLLLGPWIHPDYSQFFLRNVIEESDFALVKRHLLMLESSLRPSVLSANWVKHVDSALEMGSASHVVLRTHVSSKSRIGRKRSVFGGCDPTPVDANGGLVMLWWRGGQVSRKLFSWKVLPRSLALKAARKGGCMKISGLLYPESSDHVKRSKQIAWHAAVEMSTNVSQLALQVRELDLNIRWDEIENTHILSTLDKESQKSIKLFKKVVVRRKRVEGTAVKYLLDFGKRRLIPDVVQRHGSKVDDPESERKKYWLEESHLPLHLLRNFEEKRITHKGGKVASSKVLYSDKTLKKLNKRKDFEYLFARAEKSDYYLCGHCKKDVPIREAVSCHLCNGYFHKRHAGKPSVAITKKYTYTCYKCEPGKCVQAAKKKVRVKLQKIKSEKGTKSGSLTGKVKSKRGMKPKAEHRQVLLRNSKRVQIPEPPPHASTKANAHAGVALRRSARKAMCAAVDYNDVANGGKLGKRRISRNGKYKKSPEEPLCKKKRITPLSTFWKNGLHLSRKPNDGRAAEFKRRKLVSSRYSSEIANQPKCRLCGEKGYTAASKYISCEICEDWYHGDAFDLDTELIQRLIGFKCHACLKKSPPVCPYLEDTTCWDWESLSGQAADNAGMNAAPSLLEVVSVPYETNLVQNRTSDIDDEILFRFKKSSTTRLLLWGLG